MRHNNKVDDVQVVAILMIVTSVCCLGGLLYFCGPYL